jgi:hypothetical protein
MPQDPATTRIQLATVVQRTVGLVALLVGVGVLIAPRMSVNQYDVGAAAAGLVAVIAGWLTVAALSLGRRSVPDRWCDAAAGVVCLLLTALAGAFAFGGAYRDSWDVGILRWASAQPPGPSLVRYFSIYPNARPFLALARAVRSVIAGTPLDYEGAFAVINTVSFLVTAVAVYLTVRWLAGPARGVLALMLLGVLLGTTPWLSVAYTDMPILWAPIAVVALVTAALRRRWGLARTALLAGGAGAALAVGYLVKVTPVVGLVALVAALAVTATERRGPGRRLVPVVACAVAGFLVTVPAAGAWVKATEGLPPLRPDWAATPLTYVAAGMRTQTWTDGSTAYGAWDRYVVRQTAERDTATQNEVALRVIRAEWERRGLVGTLGFAVDKTLFNWGDGTFWARDEGRDPSAPPLRQGDLVNVVTSWNAPYGHLFPLHVLLAQVTWMAVLLALGIGLLRSRSRPEVLIMALMVAGISIFVLVFQGRSRYLLPYVPVVVALAACVVPRPQLRRPSRESLASDGAPPRSPGAPRLAPVPDE